MSALRRVPLLLGYAVCWPFTAVLWLGLEYLRREQRKASEV